MARTSGLNLSVSLVMPHHGNASGSHTSCLFYPPSQLHTSVPVNGIQTLWRVSDRSWRKEMMKCYRSFTTFRKLAVCAAKLLKALITTSVIIPCSKSVFLEVSV